MIMVMIMGTIKGRWVEDIRIDETEDGLGKKDKQKKEGSKENRKDKCLIGREEETVQQKKRSF